MTTNVQVNLDMPSGVSLGGDFAGAFSTTSSVTPGASASSVTVAATDSTGGPSFWHFKFTYSGYPSHRVSLLTPVPAGPVSFAVITSSPTILAFTADSTFLTAFPNGIPVGTLITLAGASLPAGLSAQQYYVVGTSAAGFSVSATAGGSAISTTGPGSGTFTVNAYNYTGLLTATNARATTPQQLPYPAGVATQGNLVTADDKGNPVWSPPAPVYSSRLMPSDLGFVAWTYPPHEYNNAGFSTRTGTGWLYAWRFKSFAGGTVNNISYAISTAATGTSMANCFIGIYDDSGNLLGSCATDQATNFASQGVHTISLASPVSLAPNTVYRIGMIIGTAAGTTQPAFTSGAVNSSGAWNTMGISAALFPGAILSGQGTALPNPFTPSALGASAGLPVFALN